MVFQARLTQHEAGNQPARNVPGQEPSDDVDRSRAVAKRQDDKLRDHIEQISVNKPCDVETQQPHIAICFLAVSQAESVLAAEISGTKTRK